MPKLDELEAAEPQYKIESEGTCPSFRGDLRGAMLNIATRIGLGYKETHLTVLGGENGDEFQPLEV